MSLIDSVRPNSTVRPWILAAPTGTGKEKALSDDRYVIDWAGIRRAFAPGIEPPTLLRDFARWLEGHPWGSVGHFDLMGSFSDDAPIVDGSALRREFAFFIRLPDGSRAGYWCGHGHDLTQAPIVGLGSEGAADVLADSLDGVLAKIALNGFAADRRWTDFAPDDEGPDATPELTHWLQQRLGTNDLVRLTRSAPDRADFGARMQAWMEERESFWRKHPVMIELANRLMQYRPKGKEPWRSTRFEAVMVGNLYQLRVLERGSQLVPEALAIEPLLRAFREQQYRSEPSYGLWLAMDFALFADGSIVPRFDYESRPSIDGEAIDIAQVRGELARAPRSERWVPRWLEAADAGEV